MRKIGILISTLGMIFLFASQALSGGIDNIQNQSAKYIGTLSRNAATSGADMAHYNPAGTAFLEDGLYLELDTQYVFKDYTHDVNGQEFDQDEASILPTVFAIYKKNNWSTFGYFGVLGGGGCAEYSDGNGITRKVSNVISLQTGGVVRSTGNEFIKAESLYYTFTAGGAYAFSDQFSLSLAGRYITAKKEVEASANLTVGGPLDVRYEQEADGFGYVIGFDYKPMDTINFAVRYESEIDLDFELDIHSTESVGLTVLNTLGLSETKYDTRNLPAVLGLGAAIKATDKITISPSLNIYFEQQADWGASNGKTNHNSFELGISLEYALNDMLKLTTGYLYSRIDLDPKDYSLTNQMTPPLTAHSFALGCEYKINEQFTVLASGMLGMYESQTLSRTTMGGAELDPEVVYDKTNIALAMGVQYKPF